MPAPLRVTDDDITRAAIAIVEADSIDALTMSAVAARVGVKAPSLYKRVDGREHLLRLVADAMAREIGDALLAAEHDDPQETLKAYARAYRALAARYPHSAALLVLSPTPTPLASPELLGIILQRLHTAVSRVVPGDPQPAARTLTSWVFGFSTMEQVGAFRAGGDVDEAFEWGLNHLIGTLWLGTVRFGTA